MITNVIASSEAIPDLGFMKTKKWIVGSVVIACIIFACSTGPKHLINNATAWELREQLVFLTGICAMSLMVLSMIISVRFTAMNQMLGGLDKGYVVHKWSGIYATLFILLHWFIEHVPHWLVAWNVIADPGELIDGSQYSELEIILFQSGVLIAEIMFYVFILLIVIALFKKVPYRYFRITHKLFPGVFLLLAYHAATAQLKEHWFDSAAGYLLLLLLAIGSIAAVVGLFQQIGHSHTFTTHIKTITQHKRGILDIQLQVLDKPFICQSGQYVFLQFEHSKESHPFTIASSSDNSNVLRFAIKGLGDFTKELNHSIRIGQEVIVEGPYGAFTFEDPCQRQIWIAGGIGITPFMARLEYLYNQGGTKIPVDFWYCTRGALDQQFPESLQELCEKTGVNFHHFNSGEKEYLTVDVIKRSVDNFNNLSIWFCGPQKFAQCLQKELKHERFNSVDFHYDNFSMR